jgi:hypothetical protein
MALHCTSDSGLSEIPHEQGKLLAILVLETVRHLGVETKLMFDDGNDWSPGYRMARCGPFALVEKQANDRTPQTIDCYLIGETAPLGSGGHGMKYKLDPALALFSLDRLHHATPPNFLLRARRDPQDWLDAVAHALLGELRARRPEMFEGLELPRSGGVVHWLRDVNSSFAGSCRASALPPRSGNRGHAEDSPADAVVDQGRQPAGNEINRVAEVYHGSKPIMIEPPERLVKQLSEPFSRDGKVIVDCVLGADSGVVVNSVHDTVEERGDQQNHIDWLCEFYEGLAN